MMMLPRMGPNKNTTKVETTDITTTKIVFPLAIFVPRWVIKQQIAGSETSTGTLRSTII